jgi:hypothetical protein
MELTHFVFGKFTKSNSAGRPPDYRNIIYNPEKPSADTLDWIREQISAVLPERHTARPRLLLRDGAAWLYLSVFPSLPGEQGSPNGILRYHAVRLTDAELDALRWHPWALDQFLATGIGEDSLGGSNPQFQLITENSPETQVRIQIDVNSVASAVCPVTEYSRAAEAIINTLSDGKAFYLLASANSSEASGIVSAVLRQCRANSTPIPSVAIELSFVESKPQRHTLLKVVAAESGNRGSTPEQWTGIPADHLLKPSGVGSIRTTVSKRSDESTATSRVNEIATQDTPVVSDAKSDHELNEELLRLQALLDSREQTSSLLKKELAAALNRVQLLEQQLSAPRGSHSTPGEKSTTHRPDPVFVDDQGLRRAVIPKWVFAVCISLALLALTSSGLWLQKSLQLRTVTGELERLRMPLPPDSKKTPAIVPAGKSTEGKPYPGGALPDKALPEKATTGKKPVAQAPTADKAKNTSQTDPDDSSGGTASDKLPADKSAAHSGTTLPLDPASGQKKAKKKGTAEGKKQ